MKPRVVLSGYWYPMCLGRYFMHALQRRDDLDLIVLGPSTGTYIPWQGGMHLPQKYVIKPDVDLPGLQTNVSHAPMAYAEARLEQVTGDRKADLWIQVVSTFTLQGRPSSGMHVTVGTDPHVINYQSQRAQSDIFFCMQKVYAQPGDSYLPYAYCPEWHAPLGWDSEAFTHDAGLVGLHYQERDRWVEGLRARGHKINYDLGPIGDELRDIYRAAPIVLNWSSRQDLVARVFEAMAMGRMLVTNLVPDLGRFFIPNTDLIVFQELQGALDAVTYYLDNPAEIEKIARSGQEAVEPHSYDARVEQILIESGVMA